MPTFRRWHASLEDRDLVLYRDEARKSKHSTLRLRDVASIATDFPFLDQRAYPPAFCRFELRPRKGRAWLLAVTPEDIHRKNIWVQRLAAAAGLVLVAGGRGGAVDDAGE